MDKISSGINAKEQIQAHESQPVGSGGIAGAGFCCRLRVQLAWAPRARHAEPARMQNPEPFALQAPEDGTEKPAVDPALQTKAAEGNAAAGTLRPELHLSVMLLLFGFESWDAFSRAEQCARLRTSPLGDCKAGSLLPAAHVLRALREFEQWRAAHPDDSDLQHALPLADALLEHLPGVARDIPDELVDAALVLHAGTRPHINRGLSLGAEQGLPVERVLSALFEAFSHGLLSDALLFTDTTAKLGAVLEARGEFHRALEVLHRGKATIEAFRANFVRRHRHEQNESFFSLTGDVSQTSDDVYQLVSGMTEEEKTTANLHADVLQLLFRCELRVGQMEQANQTRTRVMRLEETLRRRDEQAAIFGRRTDKERREDEARLEEAAETSSNPRHTERHLLAEADRNLYERALVLMSMAEFRPPAEAEQSLRECADALTKAQAAETALIKMVQTAMTPTTERAIVPPPPLVLARTQHSVTFLPPRGFRPKGDARPTHYAVYGKQYGAGTAVQMNTTATQYEGLGVKHALNERCNVYGLKENDSYTFAIVYFDEQGRVIGECGASSLEIPMVVPLPLLSLWSKLALQACRLGAYSVGRHACSVIWRHFVVSRPDPPLWDSNPLDSEELHAAHVVVASVPNLRHFSLNAYIWADILNQVLQVSRLLLAVQEC